MSFLILPSGIPDFGKAIIAMWVRIPSSSIERVRNQVIIDRLAATPENPVPRMSGIIPFVILGDVYDGYKVKGELGPNQDYTRSNWIHNPTGYLQLGPDIPQIGYTGPVYRKDDTKKVLPNPSFIGAAVTGSGTGAVASLAINLQTRGNGSGAWINPRYKTSYSDFKVMIGPSGPDFDVAWTNFPAACRRDLVVPGGTFIISGELEEDLTDFFAKGKGPENFSIGTGGSVDDPPISSLVLAPDVWHLILVSFDITRKTTARGSNTLFTFPDCSVGDPTYEQEIVSEEIVNDVHDPCKLWVALDDVDKTNVQQFATISRPPGLGPNGILTPNLITALSTANAIILREKTWDITGLVQLIQNEATGLPSYTHSGAGVASGRSPIGIPGKGPFVGSVRHIEMAEFKMWTGKSVDTSKESVRRLFVDAKGKPVRDPKVAIKALGNPVITLHGSSKWIKGINTGSGGDFSPTGKIIKYKPDPSLHGEQGDPQ